MGLRLGIDFGTSNSSAAVIRGDQIALLPLDPHAQTPTIVRSLLYLPRSGTPIIGHAALDAFNRDIVGRTVHLRRVPAGTIENTYADLGTVETTIFAWEDLHAPGRLFQSLKMRLPDQHYRGTSVFGHYLTLEALVATYLGTLRRTIEALTDEPIEHVTLGRPVHSSADPAADALALQRLLTASQQAGFPSVSFLEEPIGAALAYFHTNAAVQHCLIFDFGGGTLDCTVLHAAPDQRLRVLATGGIPIGGDLFDRRIMEHKLLRCFGIDGTARLPGNLPLPARLGELLLSWQTIAQLNEPDNRPLLEILRSVRSGPYARRFRALTCLITRNHGLPLFEAIERAKIALSTAPSAAIEYLAEAIAIAETLQRDELEAMIATELRAIAGCVEETMKRSGLAAEQIQAVIRTGGSSAIPAIERLLRSLFPAARITEYQRFTSVASGLALAANGLHYD